MNAALMEILIKAGGIFAIGFGVAWWVQGARLDQLRSDHEIERLTAAVTARAKESTWQKKIEEAKNAADTREKTLRLELLAMADSTVRLRDTLEQLSARLPDSPADASRTAASACYSVLGNMAVEAGKLAEAADGHAADVQTLMAAWPTN